MVNSLIENIERKLDQLIRRLDELECENSELRSRQKALEKGYQQLNSKNEQARERVANMINDLKRLQSQD